jgi:light-regulated signal transduction histidine kinase (bacteriophytochrome)
LQEPLRSIKIYSEILMSEYKDKLDGEGLKVLDYLHSGAARMEVLVRDLLSYTQLTKFEKPLEPVDSNLVLEGVLENLGTTIAESGARITADSLPPVYVQPAHLQQLFQNLIGNAIKYRSPERPPVVHISAERQNGQWCFAVRDNGIGIASRHRDDIFGLFKRLHNSSEYSGSGIGLAICLRIVEQYNGRIWVESEPGQGSVFRFTVAD